MSNVYRQIRDHLNEGRFLEACAIFNAIEVDEVFQPIAQRFPALMNYDADGNWIGSDA